MSIATRKLTLTHYLDPDLWPWPLTLTLKQGNSDVNTPFLAFYLDLWLTTLAYRPILGKVKVDPHAKNQGRRSNGSAVRAQTNGQMDATKCIISLASRSIKRKKISQFLDMDQWNHLNHLIMYVPGFSNLRYSFLLPENWTFDMFISHVLVTIEIRNQFQHPILSETCSLGISLLHKSLYMYRCLIDRLEVVLVSTLFWISIWVVPIVLIVS